MSYWTASRNSLTCFLASSLLTPYRSWSIPASCSTFPPIMSRSLSVSLPHFARTLPLTCFHLPLNSPRPRDSWVICDLTLRLSEEAVKFAAGRIEGALLLFRAVVEQWAAVGPNHITNKFLGGDLS